MQSLSHTNQLINHYKYATVKCTYFHVPYLFLTMSLNIKWICKIYSVYAIWWQSIYHANPFGIFSHALCILIKSRTDGENILQMVYCLNCQLAISNYKKNMSLIRIVDKMKIDTSLSLMTLCHLIFIYLENSQ